MNPQRNNVYRSSMSVKLSGDPGVIEDFTIEFDSPGHVSRAWAYYTEPLTPERPLTEETYHFKVELSVEYGEGEISFFASNPKYPDLEYWVATWVPESNMFAKGNGRPRRKKDDGSFEDYLRGMV